MSNVNIAAAHDIEAEREVIAIMAERPRDWHSFTWEHVNERRVAAADRLLGWAMADVQWNGVGWEYRLTRAGIHTAELLAMTDADIDKSYRQHPASNYDGGIIPTAREQAIRDYRAFAKAGGAPSSIERDLADGTAWGYREAAEAAARQEAGQDIEPGSDDPAFYAQEQ